MGQAKRRGTFEQRKAQKLAKQFGLTNAEIAEAYIMNRRYDWYKFRATKKYQEFEQVMNMVNYYPYMGY